MSREESRWYMFNCSSAVCLNEGKTAWAVRSSRELKKSCCPVCSRDCLATGSWIADVDGGGGPNEPIIPYVRGTLAKVRNELFHLRKDGYEAAQVISERLEQLYSFAKIKWNEEAHRIREMSEKEEG